MIRERHHMRLGWTFFYKESPHGPIFETFISGTNISEGVQIKAILSRENPGWEFVDEHYPKPPQPGVKDYHANRI